MLVIEMSADDLLLKPVWRADQLGQPIPASTHAVSVALPRWQDVVGYEEKKPEIIERLATGYPRFVVHPLVQELARHIGGGKPAMPFPSLSAAQRAAAFARRTLDPTAEVVSRAGVFGVVTTTEGLTALRTFWQHTGLIVSSRQAEALLKQRRFSAEDVSRSLRE